MKSLIIILVLLLSGCATQMDLQTINLLNQRISELESRTKAQPETSKEPLNASPRVLNASTNEVIEQMPYNPYPTRLNDAQKDFVNYMLNYLSDELD